MKKVSKRELYGIFIRNFWGIVYATLAVLSVVLILVVGLGVFVLLVLVGFVAFLVGNSRDKNVSTVQNIKDFIDKLNDKIKALK
ncbi:MAG: hypothetical protein N2712_03640 [Brevinematales bacterium]|nr:hypothetical protein [Brevinematales bacterium]